MNDTALVGATMPVVPAHANVIGTEDVVAAESLRIDREGLHSQEELRRRLRKAGFEATQATISRDIRELLADPNRNSLWCFPNSKTGR